MKLKFTRLLLLLGFTVSLAACSKDKDEEIASGLSCTIDGTNMTFNVNAFALKNEGGGNYSYAVFGSSDATANASAFAIALGDDAPIAPGNYTFSEDDPDDQIKMGTLNYVPAGSTTDGYISVPGPTTTPTLITVTSVDAKSIQGTFKGDIIMLTGTTPVVKTVTNGKFNVQVMQ